MFDIEPKMIRIRHRDTLESRWARAGANALGTERDYEIRFLKADGTVSLIFVTNCVSDEHACETAVRMMRPEFASFEIWRGQTCAAKGP